MRAMVFLPADTVRRIVEATRRSEAPKFEGKRGPERRVRRGASEDAAVIVEVTGTRPGDGWYIVDYWRGEVDPDLIGGIDSTSLGDAHAIGVDAFCVADLGDDGATHSLVTGRFYPGRIRRADDNGGQDTGLVVEILAGREAEGIPPPSQAGQYWQWVAPSTGGWDFLRYP